MSARPSIIALAVALVSGPLLAQAEPIAAARPRPGRPNVVEMIMEKGWRQTLDIAKYVTEARPSPKGGYVGVLALEKPMGQQALPALTLEIYDNEGRSVVDVPRAQRFAFSPDDKTVAVIIGAPYEGGVGFKPEEVVLIALRSRGRERARGLNDATKLAWLRRPDTGLSLFAEVNRPSQAIVRYDLRRNRVFPTKLLGLECAPDGKYYWLTPLESDRAGLCNPRERGERCLRAFTWNNEPIELPQDRRIQRGLVWAAKSGHNMVFMTGSGKSREGAVVDLGTGEMKPISGRIDPTWTPRDGWLVMWTDQGPGRLRRLRK